MDMKALFENQKMAKAFLDGVIEETLNQVAAQFRKDVVTICGSMRFYPLMLKAAQELSLRGKLVLMPFVTFQPGTEQESENKQMLDRMHFDKINHSESITVVFDHTRYIGHSTRNEITFAQALGIPIEYMEM